MLRSLKYFLLFAAILNLLLSCEARHPWNEFSANIAILLPKGFTIEVFADDVILPTSVAFPTNGSNRLFVNELQSGKIWIYENGKKLKEPFVDLGLNIKGGFPVAGENGLIGLEFDPDYETNGFVYITYATRNNDEIIGSVARLTDVNNKGEDFTILMTGLPGNRGHQIQNLRFGPDGMLYVSVGDAYEERKVQDLDEYHGKILRMTPSGEVPFDNPFGPDNYVYSLGFRNVYDMQFRENGDLLASDNGPTGMDRFMVVEAGGNYGWPHELGFHTGPKYMNPVHIWQETVSPVGMHLYRGDQFPEEYRGKLFKVLFGFTYSRMPNLNGKRIQVVNLSGEGQNTSVGFDDFAIWQFNDGLPNNPVDIAEGPDGSLYVTDIFQGKIYRIRYSSLQ